MSDGQFATGLFFDSQREFLVIDGRKMNKAKFFKNLVFTSKPEINYGVGNWIIPSY